MRCEDKYKKLFTFVRKSFFEEIRINLFICSLGLKSPLDRLIHQSSQVNRIFFILCLISSYLRVKKVFYFMLNQQSS